MTVANGVDLSLTPNEQALKDFHECRDMVPPEYTAEQAAAWEKESKRLQKLARNTPTTYVLYKLSAPDYETYKVSGPNYEIIYFLEDEKKLVFPTQKAATAYRAEHNLTEWDVGSQTI